jgi:predicted dehydrogenase
MAVNHTECVEMVEAFRTCGVPLWVAYYRRALPRFRLVRDLLASGVIGRVTSHALDLLDGLLGPIESVAGWAMNTGGAYAAEDVTAAAFRFRGDIAGTGVWNFNAGHGRDAMTFTGSLGEVSTPVFRDGDVVVRTLDAEEVHAVRNPPHVHQPLIQSIVDEMRGRGRCDSTGESAARTSRVMDACVAAYYQARARP